MARHDQVARAPLFDRLIDLDRRSAREPRPYRTLTYPQLLASVRQEVERLLNTRCHQSLSTLMASPPSVLTYGASDLTWVGSLGEADQGVVAEALARTINAFEPRLRGATVKVHEYDPFECKLFISIEALLITETLSEPVSFPVVVATTGRQASSDVL